MSQTSRRQFHYPQEGVAGRASPLFIVSTTTGAGLVNAALIINQDGKVVIGTTTPQGDLAVAGV